MAKRTVIRILTYAGAEALRGRVMVRGYSEPAELWLEAVRTGEIYERRRRYVGHAESTTNV